MSDEDMLHEIQARAIGRDFQAAIDLFVLETGPLEFTKDGSSLRVKQNIRLRIKEADELRAEGYAAGLDAAEEVIAKACRVPNPNDPDAFIPDYLDGLRYDSLIAAIRALKEKP